MTTNAQLNAQKGYIITNENDTLRGVIDYRSDSRNAKECHILLEGEQEYKTYYSLNKYVKYNSNTQPSVLQEVVVRPKK